MCICRVVGVSHASLQTGSGAPLTYLCACRRALAPTTFHLVRAPTRSICGNCGCGGFRANFVIDIEFELYFLLCSVALSTFNIFGVSISKRATAKSELRTMLLRKRRISRRWSSIFEPRSLPMIYRYSFSFPNSLYHFHIFTCISILLLLLLALFVCCTLQTFEDCNKSYITLYIFSRFTQRNFIVF